MAKFLVTSALPYANGPIHFGHVAGAYLPADVYVRYLRMRGHQVLYVCGTDEHGVAITLKAEQEGLGYRQYVDGWHQEIQALFDRFQIRFDIFSGTARCPQHVAASQRFFQVLLQRGFIQHREDDQWYSESMERFLPDRYLQGKCHECGFEQARGDECPRCGTWIDARKLGNPVSLLDGSSPILKKTRHWYLDLPALHKAGLDKWYKGADESRPHAAWKPNVDGHVQAMLADLRERPITRDLPWGVPLPEGMDEQGEKVLYVWFDAPIGYLSFTQEWAEAKGEPEAWREWWQDPKCKMVHFIGKDNIAFHVVLFPAMLLGQGQAWEDRNFVLPWAVPANEFYNLQGKKFSTSGGWYLDNDHFFQHYNPDAARFHLLLTAPETSDSEFTWEGFQTTNNSLLADKLGNFSQRVLKFCGKRYQNQVPEASGIHDQNPALVQADEHFAEVGDRLSRHEFQAAARALMAGCNALNQFFDHLAPWKLVKSEDAADRQSCQDGLERCLAYLELLSRRMAPFCPTAAEKLRQMLGDIADGPGDRWGEETEGQPPARLAAGAELGTPEVLFQKLDPKVIQAEIDKLHQRSETSPTA
ncbi:MAG: methionine--tRNA ligase [Planctomycetota bacterium]|nr:MAG: methionine--tRNA ligase [Planctomycetota bacterium]